jgi:coenzyme F420-0:L-glutamate ligase/coenzyme F420-1:gamma-L-glutamate ligase
MAAGITILPVEGLPEIKPGADLVTLIGDAAAGSVGGIQSGDVVVITHKIISKAEGQVVNLDEVEPSALAAYYATVGDEPHDPRQVEVVLRECVRIVKMDRGVIITETKHGFVCANSGVDASNVPGDNFVSLLPVDPDKSAEEIRAGLARRFDANIAVVVSDSFGRPWRMGITNVAIGVAGLEPFNDYRGQVDPTGYLMKVSLLAIADELASAGELAMGKVKQVPVAVVRGYEWTPGSGKGKDFVMDPTRDLFR